MTWSPTLPAGVRAAAAALVAAGRLPVLVVLPLMEGDTGCRGDPAPRRARRRGWDSDGVRGGQGGRGAVPRAARRGRSARRTATACPSRRAASRTPWSPRCSASSPTRCPAACGSTSRSSTGTGPRSAHAFPLRSLPLKGQLPAASLELRFALLSISHTEMDAVVDGAWLRNAEVSRPRPAGQTDDLVYEITCAQLAELCRGESHVRLYMYQTGLETAVVGFYKAVTDHLLRYPRSVSVQPMYYEAPRGPKPREKNPEKRGRDQDRLVARTRGRAGHAVPEGDAVGDVAPTAGGAPKRGQSASHMRAFTCKDCRREVEASGSRALRVRALGRRREAAQEV